MSGQRDGLARVLGEHHWGDDTALVGTHAVQCGCGWKATDRDIYALRARHDQHRADVLTSAGFGPVRAVVEERDKWEATAIGQDMIALNHASRAESAEAAYRAMFRQFEAMRADRDEALAALEAGDACGAVGCRALAERDRLREGVEGLADEWADDYPSPIAACNRTPDEWARELRALLASTSDRGEGQG